MRLAAAVAALGLILLAAACGGGKPSATVTNQNDAALAFSRCMRAHGVPNFPDPDAHGDYPQFDLGVPKPTANAANSACMHLRSTGSPGTPQERRQKFTFALKVAQCLRAHGYPDFPDPTSSGQAVPPGIKTDSPQFQARMTACEKQEQKALGLP